MRNLLVKAREIISDEIEAEEKDEVLIREPPTSRPLPLTRSQEATFESVEKLQAQLEDLAEGGQKNKTRSENEKVVVNSENTQKSPVRCELVDTRHGVWYMYIIHLFFLYSESGNSRTIRHNPRLE